MTFGYSRDDVGKFLPIYLSKGILQHDPFEVCYIKFMSNGFHAVILYTLVKFLINGEAANMINYFFSQVLDQKGVGQLIKMATERGRRARPSLKVSVNF